MAVLREGRPRVRFPPRARLFFRLFRNVQTSCGPTQWVFIYRRKTLGAWNWPRRLRMSGAVRLLGTHTVCCTFTFTVTLLHVCFLSLSCCVWVSQELKWLFFKGCWEFTKKIAKWTDHLEDTCIDVSQYGCDVDWCTAVGAGWVISWLLKTALSRFAAWNGCREEQSSI